MDNKTSFNYQTNSKSTALIGMEIINEDSKKINFNNFLACSRGHKSIVEILF
jgi:hypothetical protein